MHVQAHVFWVCGFAVDISQFLSPSEGQYFQLPFLFPILTAVPVHFITRARNLTIRDGETAILECHTAGRPQPTSWWSFGHHLDNLKHISQTSISKSIVFFNNSRWLVMHKARREFAGYYVCHGQATGGTPISQTNTISVVFAPGKSKF